MKLKISHDTILKPNSTQQSRDIPPQLTASVKKGAEFPVLGYLLESGHVKFTIDPEQYDLKSLHSTGKNTWYVYAGHIEDESGFSENNLPKDSAPSDGEKKGIRFNLPGYKSTFWSTDPLGSHALDFTWAEALHFNGESYRKPDNRQQVVNIIRIADHLQQVKKKFDNRPVIIKSWLRPEAINRAVGGAKNSAHVDGFGVDFSIPGYSPFELFQMLDKWHGSNGGLAYSNRMGFVHIDLKWPGVHRRWQYPGG